MQTPTYKAELMKQLKDPMTNADQFYNLIVGIFRLMSVLVYQTTIVSTAFVILYLMTADLSQHSIAEFQMGLKVIVGATGTVALCLAIFQNKGRFEFVAKRNAQERLKRFEDTRSFFYTQLEATEQVLVMHGVLTQEQVDQAAKIRSEKHEQN